MKLPSIKHLLRHASRSLGRFPLALFSAGVGTTAALILVDSGGSRDGALHNLMVAAALGLPLFTTLPILAEKGGWPRSKNLLIQLIGALLLVAYFLFLPPEVFSPPYLPLIRFFLLNIALHTLVAFAPYKGLKIFTQYVLIPLVVIYLAILYAYEARIILAWSWPKGWVANLVLGFSVSGILALLLVYPAQEQAESRWIKSFEADILLGQSINLK